MSRAAFVIHLERATQRRAQAEKLRADLPLATEILSAIDGREMSDADTVRFYRRTLHAPRYPFVLSQTEIACFLSHRRAWQQIVDGGLDGALVVEDDVAIVDERFAVVLTAVIEAAESCDYIRFPRWERGENGPVVRGGASASLVEPFLPALGAQMQWIGRAAACRLLEASTTFDRPVDSFVQMQWVHGARVLSARPIVIREIDRELGGTVLQNKTMGLSEKLVHEVTRPFFRWSIARRNRRWRNTPLRP